MRTALAAVAAGIAALLTVSPTFAAPPTDIKAYCAGKWAEYRMQAFCIDQEQAAQRRLSPGVGDQAIWARCYQKWDSWQMVDFCVKDEEKAKAKIGGAQPVTPSVPLAPTPSQVAPVPPMAPPVVAAPDYDRVAVETCGEFLTGAKRIADGVASSPFQIELEMRSVYARAERSTDRLLQQKAGALVREAANFPKVRSAAPFMAAVNDFAGYCRNTVLKGPGTVIFGPTGAPAPAVDPPRPPARPITTQEAEAMTKRAIEQSGGKKCETKVYGGGAAVTVCD